MTLNQLPVDEATRLGTKCDRTLVQWRLWRLLLLLLLILPLSCADRPLSGLKAEIPEPRLHFELVPVRTFGEPGLDSASDAALGRIASIVAADDSTLYVLDSDFKRITVFSPSGEFLRHIYGGFGEGPGEFSLPIFMDVAEDIFVYDYRQSRVSRFSRLGEYLDSFQLDHLAKQFAVAGGELWFTLLPTRDTLIIRTTIDGEFRGILLNASQDDIAFSPSGLAPTIATSLDESTAYVGVTRPGVWHRIRIQTLEHVRVGRPFYPQYQSVGSVVPGQVLGMTPLASNRVGIVRSIFETDAPPPPPLRKASLDVFDEDGAYLGSVELEAPWIFGIASSPDGEAVYLGLGEPYPHVVMYDLMVERSRSAEGAQRSGTGR